MNRLPENFPAIFRVFDHEKQEMRNPAESVVVSGDGSYFLVDSKGNFKDLPGYIDVMWHIGEVDKTGSAVFEGDIVEREGFRYDDGDPALPEYDGALGIVTYREDGFFIDKRKGEKWSFYGPEGINVNWDKDLVVVGNIFQNMSLLE